jgi:hypothetical protein
MRRRSIATTFVVITVGLAARAAVRRFAARRASAAAVSARPAPVTPVAPAVLPAHAVVLPFVRRDVPAAPAQEAQEAPAAPTRCGDSGGRTKAGAPCAARATAGGRCHHHRLAA